MIRTLLLSCLLPVFFACGSDTPAPEANAPAATPTTSRVNETSRPAPGTTTEAVVRGTMDYGLIQPDQFQQMKGCTYLLQPEGLGKSGYLVGVNTDKKIAEIMIDNEIQTLPLVEETKVGPDQLPVMVFKSDSYKMEVQITGRKMIGKDASGVSGSVNIRSRTGELNAKVDGQAGC